jgi:IS30 family transposase
LNRSKSTISREINRNSDNRNSTYRYELADKKYYKRQSNKEKHISFTTEITHLVASLIREDLSPEQVSSTLTKRGYPSVSHETIYLYIWEDKRKGGALYLHLRNKGKRYRKRGSSKDSRGILKNRISIDQRPKIVEKRTRFGDLEVDLIIGKNHNQAMVTINDRASGMVKIQKVTSKNADVVTLAIIGMLEDWSPYIHTITADNGKEFAGHEAVAEKLSIKYYFAHPYHSWERGSNENLNGLIRQYFPKGSDFTSITDEQVKQVEFKLNSRPRKRFKYETPIFVMNQFLFNSEVAFMT